ncbi:CPG DNA METHYLASE (CYTOSINE-SPECIFIC METHYLTRANSFERASE) [Mycoplasmopsis pulmonis]|uniref:DNA (cytosine-5-)-methyltransferase n=1 Tax=Mycoplasmopsis pulmonis (strain UAB CTIP) TaxID=272635 RepID=Q98RG6_MYCPU|nr:DNA cytosine methyltransferase [Mycoplasmopsis pulmonis]CAC13216.1 CPG DNA METHYLASE (CYTOSINE-SPECIFIC METHYLTRANSFERASE) [Mycoplasmopsis pulmonis]
MLFLRLIHTHTHTHTHTNFSDITKLNSIPKDIDIFTYSFPCQDISQQGKQKGLQQGSRSSLLFEIERLLINSKNHLPKFLILENVKALSHKKFENDLKLWIDKLEKLGYKSEWKILNSADYNSCQNRQRFFMVSSFDLSKFKWPEKRSRKKDLSTLLNNKYTKTQDYEKFEFLLKHQRSEFSITKNNIWKSHIKNYTNFNSEAFLYLPKEVGPTLTASGANSRIKFFFDEDGNQKIRAMNALEAYQYMGFDLDKAKQVQEENLISQTKIIYTCGNSISVEVLESLFEEVVKCLIKN